MVTIGRLLGLTPEGRYVWGRDLRTIPTGSILTDPAGRLIFGSQDIGERGVYCLTMQRGVEWYIPTQGAALVFPLDRRLLGVAVVPQDPNANKNETLVFALGD